MSRRRPVRPASPARLALARLALARLGLAAAVLSLAVSACSGAGSTAATASGKRAIQLIVGNASDPFYITMECGAEREASKLGVGLNVGGPPGLSVSGQQPLIHDVEVNRPAALVVAPADPTQLNAGLQQVQRNRTRIIFVDTASSDPALGLSRISSDDLAGGQLAADSLGALLGGRGTVAVLSISPGSPATDARVQGFEQQMRARYPAIRLLPEQNDIAATTAAAATYVKSDETADPRLSGVFAANTVTAQGAAATLRHTGETGKIKLVTFDPEPAEVGMLKDGVAEVVIAPQPLLEGQEAIRLAVDAIDGKPVPKAVQTPLVAITGKDVGKEGKYLYRATTAGC